MEEFILWSRVGPCVFIPPSWKTKDKVVRVPQPIEEPHPLFANRYELMLFEPAIQLNHVNIQENGRNWAALCDSNTLRIAYFSRRIHNGCIEQMLDQADELVSVPNAFVKPRSRSHDPGDQST